jgi:hypothetical protein
MRKPVVPLATSDRLGRVGTLYHREAKKCLRGKAYLAAVVMQVAVLEAALQAMCAIYAKDVQRTAVYRAKKFRRKRDKALEFNLYQLINIARELHWFPPKRIEWGGKQADLAGFAHEIRKLRNLVHPAAWAMERDPTKFTKGTFNVTFEVFDVANSWLLHRIEQGLLKRMKREERRKRQRK